MSEIVTSVTTGLTTVKTDTIAMLAGVVGVAVVIFGIKFATTQGIGFFKKVAK